MLYIQTVFCYLCEAKDSKFRHGLWQEFQTQLQPKRVDNFMTSIAGADEIFIAKVTKLSLDEIRLQTKEIKINPNIRH